MVKARNKSVKTKPTEAKKLCVGAAVTAEIELPPAAYALWREQVVIWLAFGGLALSAYMTGFDTLLALGMGSLGRSDFGAALAWFLRQYGTWPGAALVLAALAVLLLPQIFKRWRAVYPVALVVVVTALLGGGMLNQVIIQELADRARPRESVLLTAPLASGAELSGNSMPSGHAAMGFIFLAPFFVLQQRQFGRRRALARGFLLAGLGAGMVVGVGRMLAGAHFLSDILIAGGIAASVASLTAYALAMRADWWPVRPRWVWLGVIVSSLAVVLGNHFKLDLRLDLGPDFRRAELPCVIETVYEGEALRPLLEVRLVGFGAPLSNLKLTEDNGVVGLQTSYGFYHNLSCTARLVMPVGPFE